MEVPLVKLFEEEAERVTNTQNNINNVETLNGNAISGNSTNNFFENAEMKEKLENSLKEAFASMIATEIEKLTKNV